MRLARSETPLTLAEVASQLSNESGSDPERSPEDLQIRLHHQHIPKLGEAELVEYDPTTRSVSLSSKGRRVTDLLNDVLD